MSPMPGRPNPADEHARARELAAVRLVEGLAPDDAAWLEAHLAGCPACAGVAAAYDEQHLAFGALRGMPVEAPRDLWARTAAAIEAEGTTRGRRRGWSRPVRPAPLSGAWRLALAPVAAVVVVAVVVGSGLFNGRTFPGSAGATPIPLAVADVQVLGRDRDGNIQILTRPVGPVCPAGSEGCAAQPTFAVTTLSGLSGSSDLNGTLSPTHDRMVVIASGSGGEGVYILPVATIAPSPTMSPVPASVAPSTAPAASTTPSASAVPSAGPVTTPPPTASSSAGPDASASAGPASPSPTPAPSASPGIGSPEPPATPAPASPAPSAPVTTATGAIQIASGVTVVGPVQYSPDGTHVAFSARPVDASAGPDVYVWSAGDPEAAAITTDHGSWLAAWTADGLLVSRITNGTPATYLVDPVTARATQIGEGQVWLPVVAPSGHVAAWWDGTVKPGTDGVAWQPDSGRLVVGAWPPGAGGAAPQVLAEDPLAAWQVRWDDNGSTVAVWLAGAAGSDEGQLSLYPVNPANGRLDLAHPMLADEPAAPGFSLRTGRLAWTTPGAGNGQTLQVLAWEGSVSQRFEVPAEQGTTVVP